MPQWLARRKSLPQLPAAKTSCCPLQPSPHCGAMVPPHPSESKESRPSRCPTGRPMSGAASQAQGPASSVRQHATDQVVGSVTETKEQHLQRHDGGLRTCPRCRYYRHKEQWLRVYGCEDHASRRIAGAGAVWLSERPVRWGGFWGLGCTFCADAVARLAVGDSAGQVCARRLRSAWAR